MQGTRFLWLLVVAWLAAYVWSIWVLTTLPPEGSGFTPSFDNGSLKIRR